MNRPHLRELFDAALDLAADERAAWLVRQCPDAALRAEVERLLAADAAQSAHVIDGRVEQLLDAVGEIAAPMPPAGTRIGGFLLHEKLGEGGSSVVFRASREQAGVTQFVALKVLRRNLYTVDEQRRFRDERRALSQLQHPGIARLVEGGITEAGTPYIALELIEGEPLLDHVRRAQLDLAARLRLFVGVCRAVDAAHHALIVHRDLKPSNVLVTPQGQVKLLDFGIAKLLDAEAGIDSTHTAQAPMTPAYAAPEQFQRGQITTATDVYSLGVMLGELITGQRREAGDSRTPSSQLEDTAVPGALPAPPVRMRRMLRGDLDNIVLQASAEEPRRRYASAGALADDIERHLRDQPVSAHPPSRWYRASKFVRRHRGGVVTSAALLIAVAAALGIALWQGRIARHSAQRANAMRDFMVEAFAEAKPGAPRDGAPRITDVVSQAIAKARADGAMNRAVRTELIAQLGAVLLAQADITGAREVLQWNYDEARARFGDDDALVLEAGTPLSEALVLAGDYSAARVLVDTLLARVPAADKKRAAELRQRSAHLANRGGDYRRALAEAGVALDLARASGNRQSLQQAMIYLANQQLAVGDIAAATAMLEESVALVEREFGPVHLKMAETRALLSRAYRRGGDLARAETQIRSALAIVDAVLPPDHADRAYYLNALTLLLIRQRDFEGALAAASEGLRINRAAVGDTHTDVGNDLNSVGALHAMLGDYAAAVPPLRESTRLAEESLGSPHVETALTRTNYGDALARSGEVSRGEAEIRAALAQYEALPQRDFEQEAKAWEKLARLRLERGEPVTALELLTWLDAALTNVAAASAYWDGRAAALRANAVLLQGDTAAAIALLDTAALAQSRSNDPHVELATEIALLRAVAAKRSGRADAAQRRDDALQRLEQLRHAPAQLRAWGRELGDAAAAQP
ncbi:serine/threonine-protein kinase [Tahibacter sp.]|uniref:serine/threonine-protein kinase n=1 Tax=Tahibacter sp. TaxID=2056211 RepID=UPI0028C379FA|nr:serine/threonine-protein kinase [Tahibacter sp.]